MICAGCPRIVRIEDENRRIVPADVRLDSAEAHWPACEGSQVCLPESALHRLIEAARRLRWAVAEIHHGNAFSQDRLWIWQQEAFWALLAMERYVPQAPEEEESS